MSAAVQERTDPVSREQADHTEKSDQGAERNTRAAQVSQPKQDVFIKRFAASQGFVKDLNGTIARYEKTKS